VANQLSQQVKDFLKLLATDADLLRRFIINPDAELQQFGDKDKETIRNSVALEVAKRLVVHPSAYIHWGT
jgi:hypothetical protein